MSDTIRSAESRARARARAQRDVFAPNASPSDSLFARVGGRRAQDEEEGETMFHFEMTFPDGSDDADLNLTMDFKLGKHTPTRMQLRTTDKQQHSDVSRNKITSLVQHYEALARSLPSDNDSSSSRYLTARDSSASESGRNLRSRFNNLSSHSRAIEIDDRQMHTREWAQAQSERARRSSPPSSLESYNRDSNSGLESSRRLDKPLASRPSVIPAPGRRRVSSSSSFSHRDIVTSPTVEAQARTTSSPLRSSSIEVEREGEDGSGHTQYGQRSPGGTVHNLPTRRYSNASIHTAAGSPSPVQSPTTETTPRPHLRLSTRSNTPPLSPPPSSSTSTSIPPPPYEILPSAGHRTFSPAPLLFGAEAEAAPVLLSDRGDDDDHVFLIHTIENRLAEVQMRITKSPPRNIEKLAHLIRIKRELIVLQKDIQEQYLPPSY